MKTELILKSDVLDIIFENRNKAYGAYYLRKFYSSRLTKSLALMMAGVIVLSAFTLLPDKKQHADADEILTTGTVIMQEVQKEKEEPEKPKEKPKPKAPTIAYTTPVIVNNIVETPPIEAIPDTAQISYVTQPGIPGEQPLVGDPVDGGEGDGKGKEPVAEPVVDVNTPTFAPEVMPEYPGGMDALRRFLQRNLTNPREMEEGEMISVKVRFVVGYDGKLKSFETVEDGGEEFNKEVIRVLKKMPEWVPGKTRGQNISVYYTIPIKFVPAN